MFNCYLQEGISNMLGRLAVPMFFAISGFLFFRGTEKDEEVVYQKLRRRVKSLVVPYILTALFLPTVFLILKLTSVLDFLVSTSYQYLTEPWWMILCRVFLYNFPDDAPFAFYLWFLRDLIIVMCFTPLLWRLKRTKFGLEVFMLLMFIVTLFGVKYIPLKAFFFFCLGAKFFQKQNHVSYFSIGLLSYFIVSIIQIIFPNEVWKYFEIPIITVGVLSAWHYYDQLVPMSFSLSSHKHLHLLSQSTFYIYLYHIPLLLIVSKSILLSLHRSSFVYAATYLASPWITIACLVMIAFFLNRYLPRFYSLLVGGRVFDRKDLVF